tara:strand:+ start:1397 stop:3550 length:2154 start_codon:yes stop_codon:yes gene_type:complete
MATPQLSPGVLIREVDLTVGRADNVLDNIGAIAAPFAIGPIDYPIDISTEQGLIENFGKPISTDSQYEYWMSASSFLSYGGVLKVVRTDGSNLVNANAAIAANQTTSTVGDASLKIKNIDDYNLNHADEVAGYAYAAKTPGEWANDLKVAFIDDRGDQILTVQDASGISVGGTVTYKFDTEVLVSGGSTSALSGGTLNGVVTEVDGTEITVKVVSRTVSGITTNVDYSEGAESASFPATAAAGSGNGQITLGTAGTITARKDWYDQQTIPLDNGLIYWSQIAPKPGTSNYVNERSGRFDEMHIAVIDDYGTVTGIKANVLEKHVGLSKAADAVSAVNSPQKIYYPQYLADFSEYVYVGDNVSDASGNEDVAQNGVGLSTADGLWGQNAQDVVFSSCGNITYQLKGGKDYGSGSQRMKATLGDLVTSYRLFRNDEEFPVDYLIMGPGCSSKYESQAKAQELISIAELRKDCVAVISPHRSDVVDIADSNTQTTNVLEFFAPISSSSYAIFDTGYKYMYDRFNNRFRYVPCNADVAGLCVRTSIEAYPWFSPAGQQRGVINNAVKLAYNPSKAQRDRLYPKRINSIINSPGTGIILFGDKTALGYNSAFDRINVRRLFLTVEQALKSAGDAQLFELNDEITRANFINIVEPYLRDVQAKRGLYGFLVVCDESNNTPDIIDNNEFRADIFLKPTKSINYVTLTFVATRTGVSFEEVAGRV